jgi:hypothetical protein
MVIHTLIDASGTIAMLGIIGIRVRIPGRSAPHGEGEPGGGDDLLWDDGTPMLWDDGTVVEWDS